MAIQFNSVVRGAVTASLFFVLTTATPARAADAAPDAACLAEIERAQARMTEFNQLYEQCRKAGIPLDYPTVAKTMLEQFIPLARQDAEGADVRRAGFEAKDLQRTLDDSIAQMKAFLQNPGLAPNARRFETGKVEVKGLSFIANRVDSRGQRDRGPVFFCGYGHFDQVRKDMPLWPGYDVNIIQIELGPANTLVGENEVSLKEAEAVVKVLDEAAKHNVMVNILLSPHYFPGWAYAKWPDLAHGGGNFGYCVDAPGARQVIEKFLRIVTPMFKDKKALHSFCLSNEPNFSRSQDCLNTRKLWAEYLARTHGTVAALNACYHSHYASFEDVPIPGLNQPEFYDYSKFNEQRFAAWHKWMGDVIRSMAPRALVHAKIQLEMAVLSRWYHQSSWGVDPELFGQLLDLNGDDDMVLEPNGGSEWALAWQLQNMGYDIQRSMAKKPIFNSENHPTLDGYRGYVAPEHFRTTLWQGAVHGQGATTIWVWERSSNPADSVYGNVMDRPGCAQAVGVTCLDLNRFAGEVTALQNVKAPVAIVYSGTSIKPDRRYSQSMETIYTALNFSGIKLDFISERQLIAGKGRDYKLIVVPDATQLLPQAVDALGRLGETRLAIAGAGLDWDCYGQPTPAVLLRRLHVGALLLLDAKLPARKIQPDLCRELDKLGALPEWRVVDASTGQSAWGVEWLPAKVNGRTVINAVNLLNKPVRVKIMRGNQMLAAADLLTLGAFKEPVETLQPMTPVLDAPAEKGEN
jgi:hypothetical protein